MLAWDGEYGVTYRDDSTGQEETIDLRTTPYAKLPWRIDWPMRWAREGVDFEPAGKDHHSEGGSFDTSRKVVTLFGGQAPVSFQYDFISIKGRGGKISSSSGEVISLYDVLEVYTPEICRYLFVSTRPNTEFAISFDLDVLKIYEDYDNCERIYFGLLNVNDKRREKEKRIYELSQVSDEIPTEPGYQIPFRHLCNLLQIHGGDIDAVIGSLEGVTESQKKRLEVRCRCAWNWITTFAPEDFRFSLADSDSPLVEVTDSQRAALKDLAGYVEKYLEDTPEKAFSDYIYKACADNGVENAEFFTTVYKVLIGKERGPKLAGFLKACPKDRVVEILSRY